MHLTLGADAGGLSRYLIDVAEATRAAGHAVIAAGDGGAWLGQFEAAGFDYHVVPLKAGAGGFWRSVRMLRPVVREFRPDVIHAHYRRATLLGRALKRSIRPRPPVLYTLHLSHINVGGWRRFLTDFGDHTHAASSDAVAWLTADARVPAGRMSLIPHGVDTARFARRTDADRNAARDALGLPRGVPVAAYVGRLDDPKNEAWCLDALLHPDAPRDAHLVYAGEGPHESSLRSRAADEGLADRVTILGHADPLPVYRAADLLLLPSAREGFSLVCAEAMSVGVPHVRTRTSGAAELTVEGETGWAVAVEKEAFAARAASALALPRETLETLETLGDAAAARVRDRFTFDRQVAQTLALYERLADRAQG